MLRVTVAGDRPLTLAISPREGVIDDGSHDAGPVGVCDVLHYHYPCFHLQACVTALEHFRGARGPLSCTCYSRTYFLHENI